jgi:hypothetical protein
MNYELQDCGTIINIYGAEKKFAYKITEIVPKYINICVIQQRLRL